MAVTSQLFNSALANCVMSSYTTANRFKMALFNTAPSLSTASYSSLTGELTTGNGYTAGGAALPATLSNTVTAASSWGTSWTSSNSYTVGQVVKSSGAAGYLFSCVTAGTAGGSAPTQTTEGALDTSSTGAVFINAGVSITVWSSGNVVWTASGGSIGPAQYGVIYDSTSGYNLCVINFGSAQTATNGNTFTVSPDSTYGWAFSLEK